MNWVSGLVGVAAIGAAGYFLEPAVEPMLFSIASGEEEEAAPQPAVAEEAEAATEEVAPPVEEPASEEVAPVWPEAPEWVAMLTPEQMPEKVTLKDDLPITVPGAKQPMVISKGVQVTPLRVEGADLVVSPLAGPLEGKLPVMATDLVDVLGGAPPEPEPEVEQPAVAENESPAATVEDPLMIETIQPPAAESSEEEMAQEEPAEEEPEAPADPPAGGGGDVVAAMQESIKAGDVKEFTFDQVVSWKEGEQVERDGVSYQSGMAAYKAETIFGVKTIQAQALLQNGKVVKWIWPNSGMEIQ